MFSARASTAAILAIALVIGIDQGAALKCLVCDSRENANCKDDVSKVETTQCDSETTTSDPTGTTVTVTADPTATMVTVTADPTATTVTVTGDPTATTVTVTGDPTATTVTVTADPTTVTTADPTTVTTAAPTTVTTAAPTTVTTAAPTTVTGAAPVTSGENGGDESDAEDADAEVIRVLRANARSRRDALFARADSPACFTLTYKDNNTDVVERGCRTTDACATLSAGKTDSKCKVCNDKDSCNGSSQIALGMMSILLPTMMALTVFRQ